MFSPVILGNKDAGVAPRPAEDRGTGIDDGDPAV